MSRFLEEEEPATDESFDEEEEAAELDVENLQGKGYGNAATADDD